MIQENKELLLIDLSARWPYWVKGIITYDESNTAFTVEGIDNNVLHLSDAEECYIEDFKLYLRPMSSMTKEEKRELGNFAAAIMFASQNKNPLFQLTREALVGDFFNKHHFDYRGLIEKGLALEAKEGMYNIKEK